MNNFAEIVNRYNQLYEEEKKLIPANKSEIFNSCKLLGITEIHVFFDGCGDSGQIESITYKAGSNEFKLQEVPKVISYQAKFDGETIVAEKFECTLPGSIENFVYKMLENNHSGWENNDGAYGDFFFNVEEENVIAEYNERFTDVTTTEHKF